MDSLAKQLEITSYNRWYSVTKTMIINHRGRGILRHYNGSLPQLVQTIYPEYQIRNKFHVVANRKREGLTFGWILHVSVCNYMKFVPLVLSQHEDSFVY